MFFAFLFFLRTELLLQLRAYFSDLIFQTCPHDAVRRACLTNIELSLQSRALFLPAFKTQ